VIRVITNHPVAEDSRDHTHPWGTMRDNSTSVDLLYEMRRRFGWYSLLDLGCAGGQFVIDSMRLANLAVGLEGSDYSARTGRANWPEYHNKNLFTCDISRPFTVVQDGPPWLAARAEPLLFDVITAWEVMEGSSGAPYRRTLARLNRESSFTSPRI